MDHKKRKHASATLHDLVESDDNFELVRELLNKGADPNDENIHGETLLHVATKSFKDNPKIVQELINAGADVNKMHSCSSTPLHYAVICRKRNVVDILLKSNISINHQNEWGETALHLAIDNLKIICPIFKRQLQVGKIDLYIVRKLLDHKFINVNEANTLGETALVWAIMDKQFKIVKMLLNKNASLDTVDLPSGNTPLHVAIIHREPYSAAALLLKKANIFAINDCGTSPMDILLNLQNLQPELFLVDFCCVCLGIIAFNYSVKELLRSKISHPLLSEFLESCWAEIQQMKRDIIIEKLTIFDFFSKCNAVSGLDDPVWQIYKPVIERLVNNDYPKYFCFLLNRIPKSKFSAVLEIIINEKYFFNKCDSNACESGPILEFLKVFRSGLLSEYLSRLDLFCLILTFTSSKNFEYVEDFPNHECYIEEFWNDYT